MTPNNPPSPDEGKPEVDPKVNKQELDPANGQPDSGNPNPEPKTVEQLQVENAQLTADLKQVQDDYGASSREAQILVAQIKEKDAQIVKLTTPHAPTDDDLRAAYPEWEQMLPTEQRLARENFSLRRGLASTQQTQAEIQAELRWEKDFKKLLKQTDFTGLKGREDEFEEYVFKPSHKGVPTETLARSFLFGTQPVPPAPSPKNSPPTGERSSGGPNPGTGKKKLTLEEAKVLRENNFEEYRRQLTAGNIEDDI